ncbi:MAG: hypothetical protein WKG07_15210 [Hymenobacter sp.]
MLVVLSDVKLPDGHGVELLPRYQRRRAAWPRWCCSRPSAPFPTACGP